VPQPIKTIAVDPSQPTTVYVAGQNGIAKSTDSGASWRELVALEYANGIGVDPTNSQTLYVAAARGIYKSIDAGQTWTMVHDISSHLSEPMSIHIPRSNPATVYCATRGNQGLFRSNDAGATWTSVLPNPISDLAIDPRVPTTVYAVGNNSLYKSVDGGSSWTRVSYVYCAGTVAVDGASNVYVGCSGLVWRSRDGGATWQVWSGPLLGVLAIRADLSTPGRLFAITDYEEAYMTTDGGQTWSPVAESAPLYIKALAVDPQVSTTAYSAITIDTNRPAIFKSNDAGGSWLPASAGIPPGTFIGALAIEPDSHNVVYAAAAHANGEIYKSVDGAGSWALVGSIPRIVSPPLHGIDVRRLVIDPELGVLYAVAGVDGVAKSADGGRTWTSANLGLGAGPVYDLIVDPRTPSKLYVGTEQGVFKSIDSGANWVQTANSSQTYLLAMQPDSGAIFAGLVLRKSLDEGANWTASDNGLPGPVFRLAVDSGRPNLYALAAGGAYRSTDSGASWAPFNDGLLSGYPSGPLTLDSTGTILYAGARGVWQRRQTTGQFHVVAPCRAVDTRTSDGPSLSADSHRTFQLTGRCGIPAAARSVSANVTVTGGSVAGHLRIYPAGSALSSTSSVNFESDRARANNVIALLGPAGDIVVYAATAGRVDLIIDVNGYFP
jgi:photosystem II stability/assembly factor-like uncharacterized protein